MKIKILVLALTFGFSASIYADEPRDHHDSSSNYYEDDNADGQLGVAAYGCGEECEGYSHEDAMRDYEKMKPMLDQLNQQMKQNRKIYNQGNK